MTPALQQQAPDGSLSTGRAVWQDFVHFLPGVAGASGDFDANGPYTRVLAAAGTNTLSNGTSTPGAPASGGLLGTIGSVLGLGKVFSTAPPGASALVGARPQWVGDLTSADFRPDVPCTSQALPSLSATTAAPDLRRTSSPSAPRLTMAQMRAAVAQRRRQQAARTGSGGGR